MKKHEFQIGELEQLKLKTTVIHGDRDEEVHMIQLVRFFVAESVLVDLVASAWWSSFG